jgi:hypothetical protein
MRTFHRAMALAAALITGAGLATAAAAPALAAGCTRTLGANCGPYYVPAQWQGSNGSNTYDANQNVGANAGTTSTLTGPDPATATSSVPMSVTANAVPYGYLGVQLFPDVQQLFNNWNGSGWGNCGTTCADTPVAALPSLTVTYAESGPADAASIYQFAPDVWNDSYPSDIMFWPDVHGRCDPGAYGGTVLGTALLGGQTWTVNRYGGAGAEIIFVLDSDPAVPNSCAQQAAGTIDILAGLQWLAANGFMPSLGSLSQLNTGWEITSADNTTFTLDSYTISTTGGGGGGTTQQPPAVTTDPATAVTATAAALNGTVSGAATYQFDWGTTTAYGNTAGAGSAGSGTSAVAVSAALTGLAPATTYHYRVQATNPAGTTFGADQTFTTPRHHRRGPRSASTVSAAGNWQLSLGMTPGGVVAAS